MFLSGRHANFVFCMDDNNKIIIYQTEDGQTLVDVRMENDTVWLTQAQMAELNGVGLPRQIFKIACNSPRDYVFFRTFASVLV